MSDSEMPLNGGTYYGLYLPSISHLSNDTQRIFLDLIDEHILMTHEFAIQSINVAENENSFVIEFYFLNDNYSITLSLNSWKLLENKLDSYTSVNKNLDQEFPSVDLKFYNQNLLVKQLVHILEALEKSSDKYFNINNFEGFDFFTDSTFSIR
jgi:hypothetical protein